MPRPPGATAPDLVAGAPDGEHVGVGELHALRRPGRARRCRSGRARPRARPRARRPRSRSSGSPIASSSSIEIVPSGASPSMTTTCSRLSTRSRASSTWSRKACSVTITRLAGVGDDVLDLLRRGGVVDREAGGAEVHRGGVGELEGGPVDEHEADRVAAPDAERGEPGGAPAHRLRVLGEARLVVAVLEPQRRRVAAARRRSAETPRTSSRRTAPAVG